MTCFSLPLMLTLVAAAGDVVEHGLVQVELVAQLVEVRHLDLGAAFDGAAVGLQPAEQPRLSRADLPQPFGPMMPMRSPRRMVVVKSRMTGRPSQAKLTSLAWQTSLPEAPRCWSPGWPVP